MNKNVHVYSDWHILGCLRKLHSKNLGPICPLEFEQHHCPYHPYSRTDISQVFTCILHSQHAVSNVGTNLISYS